MKHRFMPVLLFAAMLAHAPATAQPILAQQTGARPGSMAQPPKARLYLAQQRIFRLQSPLPFPLQVRILGPGPSFPMVVMTPAPPGAVPIPYPNTDMRLQVRMPNGQWSPIFTLAWTPGILRPPAP